jgi:hypothetical protein
MSSAAVVVLQGIGPHCKEEENFVEHADLWNR